MNKKLLSLAAILAAGAAAAASIGAGPGGDFVAVWGGTVADQGGVLKALGPFEYASVSAAGGSYAVVTVKEGKLPPVSDVRVYDGAGKLRWSANGVGASRALVADSGAAALVTMVGTGPSATSHLDFYGPTGAKTGGADLGMVADAAYFPGGDRLAVAALGGETHVFDVAAGSEEYTVPGAQWLAAGPGDRLLVFDTDKMALYQDGRPAWHTNHGLYFPRLARIKSDGTAAVVGAHHELALVDLATGEITRRWEAPADFGVTDVAAAADFSSFAAGVRSLGGVEAVFWLDGRFQLLEQEEHKVAQPSGSSPVVAVLGGETPAALALGQGWQTVLGR